MKLPNGYGTVKKLSGKRRNPFMVQKTVGWKIDPATKKTIQVREIIGYYHTRSEAFQALSEYNANPYDIQARKITFGELYAKWSERHYQKISASTITSYSSAFKYCASIVDIPIADLKTSTLQNVVDSCQCGSNTKANIKVIMRGVFEYALQNDLVNNNYAQFIEVETSDPVIDRIPYTDQEIEYLWSISDRYDARILLILLYTGMRVNELLKMKRDCCNLEENYLYIEKSKNKTSIRKVPIHHLIVGFVEDFYNKKCETLITNTNNSAVKYNNFVSREFKRLNQEMHTEHRLHDTRHTFISNAHRYKLDPLSLKKIVGHAPDNITERIYTHLTLEQLQKEIEKIK